MLVGGIDLGLQLWQNNGNWSCVNWGSVGGSFALGALTSGLAAEGLFATRGSVTLYRAVSESEAASIRSIGEFSAGPNSLGGKWFAETLEHAKQWGDLLNGNGASTLLEVKLPKSVADQFMRIEKLDGIGPARYGELEQLKQVIIRELP